MTTTLRESSLRLAPLEPDSLSSELRAIHDGIASLVAGTQRQITVIDERGALIGPFPAMLHFPQFGVPALMFQRALNAEARLPKTVREVAILTVGAFHGARYLLYAHELTAAEVGLSSAHIATLSAGERPFDLTDQEAIAHDVARALASGHILPASTYNRALELLGRDGVGELVFLVGGFALIATVLNAFDVPVPAES